MKRLPLLTLTLLSFTACGGGGNADDTTGDDTPAIDAMPGDPDAAPDVDAMPTDPDAMPTVADAETCATARVITADTTIAGTDFVADFADDQSYTDDTCTEGEGGAEAVFEIQLAANQLVTVTQTGTLDSVMGFQQTCGNAEVCSATTDDPETLSYAATTATTLYLYVGSYYAAPGTVDYSIGIAFTAITDLGTFGDAGTITVNNATPIATDASAFYSVTFSAPVRVTGTVTATAGDPDWYASTPTVPSIYVEADSGDEVVGDELERYFTAGTYLFEVKAYEELTAGFTMSLTTVAPAHTDLGSFAAAATIADVVRSTTLPAASSEYFRITLTDPVLLSGSLTAGTTGDMDLYWWKAGDVAFVSDAVGDETLTDQPLPAGTYFVRTNAFWDGGDVDTYTLHLTTTAAP